MKIQTLERRIQTAARDLELEISAMGPDSRTRHGERREHLVSELELLKSLLTQIDAWGVEQSREAIRNMEMFGKNDAARGEGGKK